MSPCRSCCFGLGSSKAPGTFAESFPGCHHENTRPRGAWACVITPLTPPHHPPPSVLSVCCYNCCYICIANPRGISGGGVSRLFVINFSFVLATPATALVPSGVGSCPCHGLYQSCGEGEGLLHLQCNSLSSILPYPGPVTCRGYSSAAVKQGHSTTDIDRL